MDDVLITRTIKPDGTFYVSWMTADNRRISTYYANKLCDGITTEILDHLKTTSNMEVTARCHQWRRHLGSGL